MRIAYISTYPPIECGIGTYTSYLNEEIKKHDNETFIISQIGAQGKNVFPIFRAQSVSIGDQVFKITAKITPDLVHIQHEYGLYGPQKGVQIVGLILRYRLVDVPVVITLHTVSPKLRHYEEIILQSIVNGCSAIIVHEGRQKETLVKYFGQAKKIHVIPHGVREISPVKDAKKKLEVEGKKVILLCGYFRPTKGFHKIVEIFPKVCEKVDNAVLMIAGKSRGLEYKDYQKEFFEA
ncbi:MAG: glycosyltransferase, partial [Candidatus Omnitrophica bacterium]|nr:glycosyltransferase [Candidatus Omnitrophota bacterium]